MILCVCVCFEDDAACMCVCVEDETVWCVCVEDDIVYLCVEDDTACIFMYRRWYYVYLYV